MCFIATEYTICDYGFKNTSKKIIPSGTEYFHLNKIVIVRTPPSDLHGG